MDLTKVSKDDLLTKLKTNREEHKKEFEKAKKVWKKEATKALKKASDLATKEGVITLTPLSELPKPKHYLDSYDLVIARLEMEVEDHVELDDHEFQSWVMNNWNWKGQFVAGTSLYSNVR